MSNRFFHTKLHLGPLSPKLVGLFLVASGSIILAWVGWLAWYDLTAWGKDGILIFYGSRTGEAISLGIGMRVVHYFLIGLVFLVLGSVTFLARVKKPPAKQSEEEEKLFSGCLRHFGYLASRPKNTPIPQECIICQRVGDCMISRAHKKSEQKGRVNPSKVATLSFWHNRLDSA